MSFDSRRQRVGTFQVRRRLTRSLEQNRQELGRVLPGLTPFTDAMFEIIAVFQPLF